MSKTHDEVVQDNARLDEAIEIYKEVEKVIDKSLCKITDLEYGAEYCPLCRDYFHMTGKCYGCPIMEETGDANCGGTPFGELENAIQNVREFLDRAIFAVADEIKFLEGCKMKPPTKKKKKAKKKVLRHPKKVSQVYVCGNDLYMVSQVSGVEVALIGLDSQANRWSEAVEVNDVLDITDDEWREITGNNTKSFKLVNESISEII